MFSKNKIPIIEILKWHFNKTDHFQNNRNLNNKLIFTGPISKKL